MSVNNINKIKSDIYSGKSELAIATMTNGIPNSLIDVKATKQVTIKYIIKPSGGQSKNLKQLPYAAAINNHVLPMFANKVGKAEHSEPALEFKLHPRDTIGLYLGSDAKKDYRQELMYVVTASEMDAVVTIREKPGRHTTLSDIPQLIKTENNIEYYEAPLTGNHWLRFSHKYKSHEVDSLLPNSIDPNIKDAVKRIYNLEYDQGTGTTLSIELSGYGSKLHKIKLHWQTNSASNVHANIENVDDRADVFTRVHPRTYAALIRAAARSEIDELEISSGWRPMLGSVVHRIGLGLDVSIIAKNGDYTTIRRSKTFGELSAEKSVADARTSLVLAEKTQNTELIESSRRNLDDAVLALPKLKARAIEKAEPEDFIAFRQELGRDKDIVRQIFDPWRMDVDSTDNVDPDFNKLHTSNETLHSNHLHITAIDEGLGFGFSSSKK